MRLSWLAVLVVGGAPPTEREEGALSAFLRDREELPKCWRPVDHDLILKWLPHLQIFRRSVPRAQETSRPAIVAVTKDGAVLDFGDFHDAHEVLCRLLSAIRAKSPEEQEEVGRLCVFILRQFHYDDEAARDPSEFAATRMTGGAKTGLHFMRYLGLGDLEVWFDEQGKLDRLFGYKNE